MRNYLDNLRKEFLEMKKRDSTQRTQRSSCKTKKHFEVARETIAHDC